MTSPDIPDDGRRLEAIMFTDIVGYTALMQADERLSLRKLEEHNQILRAAFQKYHGREVKTIGDSFLVEFESALEAFNCAVEIQRSFRNRARTSNGEWTLEVRIGIHLGDVIHRGNDIFGDAVNIASRIQPLAEPGGICISEQVYAQVHNKTDIRLQELKQTELKNVRFQTKIYSAVLGPDDPFAGDGGSTSGPDKLKIAVLPFSNLSPNPDDAFIADGMTEEIITTLSGINALSVISRTSVMGYKGTTKKLKEIGRELDVGSVLEGSLRKAGNRIRISAQLIDVPSDRHLWAQNYDRELNDVFEIQSDIASNIAQQLKTRLVESEKIEQDIRDIDVYTMYMKATQLLYESDEASIRRAIGLFETVIAKDPTYARAVAGLSLAWVFMAVTHRADYTASLDKAARYATRAVEVDPNCDDAHSALATVYNAIDKAEEMIFEAKRAIQLNPNNSDAYFLLGMADFFLFERTETGLQELERARELDPLRGSAVVLAYAYDLTGREKDAIELLLKIRYIDPTNAGLYDDFANHYMHVGDFQSAREAIEEGLKIESGNPGLEISRGILFALTGEKEKAVHVLDDLKKSSNETTRLGAALYIGAALGELDEPFKALMRLAETHAWPYDIRLYPLFTNLRKDPRYKEFCARVRIPP